MRKLMHRREILTLKRAAEGEFNAAVIRYNACPWWQLWERQALRLTVARHDAVVSTLCQVLNGHAKPSA